MKRKPGRPPLPPGVKEARLAKYRAEVQARKTQRELLRSPHRKIKSDRKRLQDRLTGRRLYERKHPGCADYRPTGRPGGPVGPRSTKPIVRLPQPLEASLARRSANWLWHHNAGHTGKEKCKYCKDWFAPSEMVGKLYVTAPPGPLVWSERQPERWGDAP